MMSLPRQKPRIALLFSLIIFTFLPTSPDRNNLACFVVTAAYSAASEERECNDTNENCNVWASSGECEVNPGYMHVHCPVSCDTCRSVSIFDAEERAFLIEEAAKYGERQRVEVSRSRIVP